MSLLSYCKEADTLLQSKDYDEAIGKYTKAITLFPDAFTPLIKRSAAYSTIKKYHLALRDLYLAYILSDSQKHLSVIFYRLSLLLYSLKKVTLALQSMEKSISYGLDNDIWLLKFNYELVKNPENESILIEWDNWDKVISDVEFIIHQVTGEDSLTESMSIIPKSIDTSPLEEAIKQFRVAVENDEEKDVIVSNKDRKKVGNGTRKLGKIDNAGKAGKKLEKIGNAGKAVTDLGVGNNAGKAGPNLGAGNDAGKAVTDLGVVNDEGEGDNSKEDGTGKSVGSTYFERVSGFEGNGVKTSFGVDDSGKLNVGSNSVSDTGAKSVSGDKPTPLNTSSIDYINKHAPLRVKIREDWYQTSSEIIITIYAKNITEEELRVEFGTESVHISFPNGPSSDYNYDLDPLFGEISPYESNYKIFGTKLEIILVKKNEIKWSTLEKSIEVIEDNEASKYPSSSKKNVNWSKFQVQDEETNEDPNAFFTKLYEGTDEDSKRAMMKSYIESNGTILTTNWKDAKDKTFETTPPKGMEPKKW